MESLILELSRYTADEKPYNAQWKNIMNRPIKINNSDSIMIKQCFIDTRLIDSTSILIERDVEWTLKFCYYIMCHGVNQYQITFDPNPPEINFDAITPDGCPYILSTYYDPITNTTSPQYAFPLIDSFVVKIPAGTYERAFLATYITKQFQTINQPQNKVLNTICFTNGQIMPTFDDNNNCNGFTTPCRPPLIPKSNVTSFQKPLYAAVDVLTVNPTPSLMLYYDGQGQYQKCAYFRMINEPDPEMTYAHPNNFFQTASSNKYVGNKTIGGTNYDLIDGGYIGASQVALTYNDNNSGKYSFQYIHSPLINNGNQCVGTYITNQNTGQSDENNIQFLDSYSGIIFCDTFTNLSDDPSNDPFFTQLGFKYSDIVSPDIKGLWVKEQNILTTGGMSYSNFLKYTTKNFFPESALSDISKTTKVDNYEITSYASILSDNVGYTFQDSNITDEIVASSVPISSNKNAGHYELELISGYNNEYITNKQDYNIKAIIGTYFLTQDSYAQTLAPDSYIYTHRGGAITLQSFTCRILNPITKQLEENLGGNSCVYIQIIRGEDQNATDTEKK